MWRKIVLLISIVFIIWGIQSNFFIGILTSAGNTFVSLQERFFPDPERQRLNKLRDDFMLNNMSLQVHQTDYVIEVTKSTASVRTFYKRYCSGNDKNPYLFGANLSTFCRLIDETGARN